MSGKFVRSSKFRHVFGTPKKKDQCYDNVRLTKSPWESNMSDVNGKFLAVVLESQGGGAFLVCPLGKVKRSFVLAMNVMVALLKRSNEMGFLFFLFLFFMKRIILCITIHIVYCMYVHRNPRPKSSLMRVYCIISDYNPIKSN